jgi:hypothetical protein
MLLQVGIGSMGKRHGSVAIPKYIPYESSAYSI